MERAEIIANREGVAIIFTVKYEKQSGLQRRKIVGIRSLRTKYHNYVVHFIASLSE